MSRNHLTDLMSACFGPADASRNALLDPSLQVIADSLFPYRPNALMNGPEANRPANVVSRDAVTRALAVVASRARQRVRNVIGTSDHRCGCPSRGHHWMRGTGRSFPVLCCVYDCFNRAEVGAHVQKVGNLDLRWFITPLCKEHNASSEVMELTTLTELVLADACR